MAKLLVILFALTILINVTNAIKDDQKAENVQQLIQEHNEAYNNGTSSFRMKFNANAGKLFTRPLKKLRKTIRYGLQGASEDFNDDEYETHRDFERFEVKNGEETAPESLDLRDRGVVSSVEHQGECDSCWAFAVAGLLEAMHKNQTGELVEQSKQYLLDCSYYPLDLRLIDDKCGRGNYVDIVLQFIKTNGMVREEDYPYTGTGGKCNKARASTGLHQINELFMISYDERAMKEALHRYGPLIAMIGISSSLQYYQDGVYSIETNSDYWENPHAVLIVGYGTDPEHGPYWIAKNSWGVEWGEEGYFRVTRNPTMDGGVSHIVYFAT